MEEIKEKLKAQIIEQLNLEDIEVSDIENSSALFGDDGLGLDSIDALELIVLLDKEYGVKIPNPEEGKSIFYSVDSIAEFIQANK